MATFAQTYTLTIAGSTESWAIARVIGHERVHATWSFEVHCRPVGDDGLSAAIDAKALLTKEATLGWPTGEGTQRVIEGFVDAIDWLGSGHYVLTLRPKLAFLEDAVDHVVFVDLDAVSIAKKVLGEHTIEVDERITRTPPKRPQCVQGFESDLSFVSRLLAEEGITWFMPLEPKNKVVFTDHAEGFADAPGYDALEVREESTSAHADVVFEVEVRGRKTHDKSSLRDYDFTKPLVDQNVSSGTGKLERYEYPGHYDDPKLGKTLAEIRLEELSARALVLTGKTSCRGLAPGYVFEVSSQRSDLEGRWLVLELEQRASDRNAEASDRAYEASFVAVPAKQNHRPPRPRHTPTLGGLQTATVVGPAGSEIHTEEHGRIKTHLRWDRRNPVDDTCGAWFRVLQPPTSGGFFLPRGGWEVLLAFHGTTADVPYQLGRMYNSAAPPPSGLPGKKTSSAFGTQTTPGGGSANCVSMDDTAGSEGLAFNASHDFNEKTVNDKTTNITADDSTTVGANRKIIVGQVGRVEVNGAQSYSVGANRTVGVDANMGITASSESIMIGGLRAFKVGGDYVTTCSTLTRLVGAAKVETGIEHQSRAVKGAATIIVGGTWKQLAGKADSVRVGGASTLAVAGAKKITSGKGYFQKVRGLLNETLASRSIKAGGDRVEGFSGAASYAVAGSATMKGAEIVVTATSKITIKAGGCTVTITSGKITIDGKFKGTGDSADDGSKETCD